MVAIVDLVSSPSPSPISERSARAAAARQEAREDAARVKRFNAGEVAAFDEIVAVHRDRIQAVAQAFLRNFADAEEITQDTFLRAHRGLGEFRGDSSLATWLHRIAMNLARNRYWYFHRRRRHLTLSLDASLQDGSPATFADLVATDAADPARAAVADEFTRLIDACMEKLADRPRAILQLRNTLNRSYRDIASECGTNIGTVKSRIARARANLRDLMAKECPEFAVDALPIEWLEPVRMARGLVSVGG
jgi:RNA polymerase sigma-70 factor (ECF subfamily)